MTSRQSHMTESRPAPSLDSNTATPSRRPATRLVLWIVAVAIVLRALYAVGVWMTTGESSFYGQDSGTYIEPARELLNHGAFSRLGQPELQRTPGFPVFLIPAIMSGHLTLTVIVLHVLLSGLTVLATFVLAQRVFNDSRIAVSAAALYAIEPLSIACAAAVTTETLFTTMVVGALILVVGYVRHNRLADLLAGAALLGVSAYVRPAGYFLPFGIALVLNSTFVALAALLVGFVSMFVMAIAWMRPKGYPTEHHPKIDRIVDDTAP